MANAIYDPRVEPHHNVIIVDETSGRFHGLMECIEGMTTILGNQIISLRQDGIRIRDHQTGEEYLAQEAEVSLTVAVSFGYGKKPAEIADGLIETITQCPHLAALWDFERRWRDLWRRLVQYPCEVQLPGYTFIKDTEYFRVAAAFAEQKREIERGIVKFS